MNPLKNETRRKQNCKTDTHARKVQNRLVERILGPADDICCDSSILNCAVTNSCSLLVDLRFDDIAKYQMSYVHPLHIEIENEYPVTSAHRNKDYNAEGITILASPRQARSRQSEMDVFIAFKTICIRQNKSSTNLFTGGEDTFSQCTPCRPGTSIRQCVRRPLPSSTLHRLKYIMHKPSGTDIGKTLNTNYSFMVPDYVRVRPQYWDRSAAYQGNKKACRTSRASQVCLLGFIRFRACLEIKRNLRVLDETIGAFRISI